MPPSSGRPEDYHDNSVVRVPAGYVQHGLPMYYGLIDQALSIHYRFYGAGESVLSGDSRCEVSPKTVAVAGVPSSL